jgi:Major capsid protein N-terminus
MATPITPVQAKPHTLDVKGPIEQKINDSNVIKFERYEQKQAIAALNKSHVLDLERRIQNKIIPLLGGSKVVAHTRALQNSANQALNPPPPVLSAENTDAIHQPVEVNGFYNVTGDMEATFYATTPWPGFPVGSGWTGIGIYGIVGNIHITGSKNAPGSVKVTSLTSEPYVWSFTMQSDVEQFIEGVIHATGASLYPPNQVPQPTPMRSGPVYGNLTVIDHIPRISFTAPPPDGTAVGWSIVGLPIVSACKITILEGLNATLHPLDDSIPDNTGAPIFIRGSPTMAVEPKYIEEFVPAKLYTSDLLKRKPVDINPNVMGGKTYVPLRDLGTEIKDIEGAEEKYLDIKGRGFSAGSVLSLFAVGPQDKHLTQQDPSKSQYHNQYRQHTNFVMYQKVIPFPPPNPAYQDQKPNLVCWIWRWKWNNFGHLISNMYFTCTVPAITTGYGLNENIGRSLIKQVDFMVNETVIETLYDDWYIIRDQMFLDADEQLGMYSMVGGLNSNISSSASQTIVCPLEFFFCRRHSHSNKGHMRHVEPARLYSIYVSAIYLVDKQPDCRRHLKPVSHNRRDTVGHGRKALLSEHTPSVHSEPCQERSAHYIWSRKYIWYICFHLHTNCGNHCAGHASFPPTGSLFSSPEHLLVLSSQKLRERGGCDGGTDWNILQPEVQLRIHF